MTMNFRRPQREQLELNLIPLIDVVFMLLIFFMLTTTFIHDRVLDVTLPTADTGTEQEAPLQNHVVELSAQGTLALDGELITEEELAERFEAIAQRDAQVVLWADAEVINQRVVTVLDLARRAGVARIGMGTAVPVN